MYRSSLAQENTLEHLTSQHGYGFTAYILCRNRTTSAFTTVLLQYLEFKEYQETRNLQILGQKKYAWDGRQNTKVRLEDLQTNHLSQHSFPKHYR